MNNPYMMPTYNTFPQRYEVIHVHGVEGAEAFQMAPNSNTLLLDETAPIVWLVQTDGAGFKTKTAYDITPHKIEDKTTNLEERIKRLEDIINAKSDNTSNSKSKNTAD